MKCPTSFHTAPPPSPPQSSCLSRESRSCLIPSHLPCVCFITRFCTSCLEVCSLPGLPASTFAPPGSLPAHQPKCFSESVGTSGRLHLWPSTPLAVYAAAPGSAAPVPALLHILHLPTVLPASTQVTASCSENPSPFPCRLHPPRSSGSSERPALCTQPAALPFISAPRVSKIELPETRK